MYYSEVKLKEIQIEILKKMELLYVGVVILKFTDAEDENE
jgi:hypothetical protein